MKWNKYTIETTTAAEDYMSAMLADLGIEGVEIEDNIPLSKEDQADMFIDFLPELPPDDGVSHVSFYLEDNGEDYTELLKQVKIALEDLRKIVDVGSGVITSDQTEDLDWINNWKKFFNSFYIEDILIKPTWEELKEEDKDKFLIEIDPGVSFGTGKHETTQLCIRQLLKYIRGNAEYTPENKTPKVLDVGCGSGILSIVALKLGASEVVGTDLDPDCMTSTHENFEVNHLDSRLGTFYVGNLIDDVELQEKVGTEEYDIVVANILADVIIPIAGIVDRFLKPGGVFISSGIIYMKEEEVKDAINNNSNLQLSKVVNHRFIRQSHTNQQFICPLRSFFFCHQSGLNRSKHNVSFHRIIREKIKLLEYHTDFLAHFIDINRSICNIRSLKENGTRCRFFQKIHRTQKCRFSTTGRADNRNNLTLGNGRRYSI